MNYIKFLSIAFALILTGCDNSDIAIMTAIAKTDTHEAVQTLPPVVMRTNTSEPVKTSTLTPTVIQSGGSISGMVFDNNMKPLLNIFDGERIIVALVCHDEIMGIDCLPENYSDMKSQDLLDSICTSGDSSENCQLFLGQGATKVEEDGSYTFANLPPGDYSTVLLFKNQQFLQITRSFMKIQVMEGETAEFDISTNLTR